MRKLIHFLSKAMCALFVISVALSCDESGVSDVVRTKMTFGASYSNGDAKSVLADATKVYWENGDQIFVSGAEEPFVATLSEPSAAAQFTGETVNAEVYYAAHPYSAVGDYADELLLMTLPSFQQARSGSFETASNLSVSCTTSAEKSFVFHHIPGYLKFAVGADSGNITSLTVQTIAGESLSGSFYVDCTEAAPEVAEEEVMPYVKLVSDSVLEPGDYYIAMLPGVYSKGLSFTFEGPDGVAVKTIEQQLELGRGKINTLGTISGLEWDNGEAYYVEVDKTYDDWSGEYLITYSTASTIKVFNSFSDTDKGASTVDLVSSLTSDGIPADTGDAYKATIVKVDGNYSINITGLGYIGLESSGNKVHKSQTTPSSTATKYLWKITYKDGGSIWLTNVAYSSRRLKWNSDANCFRCYESGQKELTLYRRTKPVGGTVPTPTPTPDPEPDPEPDPTPDPEPDPEPDPDPTPTPTPGTSGKYGWYELPVISYRQSGSYLIDNNDSKLYYAHHLCAGNEKGPGGKQARNYTVCFSAEHHCPVWVAAPRHTMYQSGASRTNAYAKDPSIPSDIQYNSKSTGGGCNKGHMLGSAERLSSTATNKQVFYYSNIAPQYTDTFNTGGGGWNTLEDWVDGQVCSDTLYVVIGAYFDKYTDKRGYTDTPATISYGGRSDVHRPTMFYYILMRTKAGSSGKPLSQCSASEIKCAAFVRSHKTPKGVKVSADEMMSVSDLEKVTGFTYFPNVPQAPKNTYNAADWGL